MTELIVELLKQYPVSIPLALFLIAVVLAFHAGITWSTFRYMRAKMVTKQELVINLLRFRASLDKRYELRRDWQDAEFEPKFENGKANGAGA